MIIVFFLSNLSVSAPANILISTYGAYEHMVSAAVLKEDPVFSYSHKVSANVVMLLPSWDTLCVLHKIRKSFNGFNLCFLFISLLLFVLTNFKTEAKPEDIKYAKEYCGIKDGEEFNWGLIRTAYASKADYAVIQMQDILGLGTEARMNVPSTLGGNWVWRIDPDAITEELAQKLLWMSDTYGRLED